MTVEDLESYGLEWMTEDEVGAFLGSQSVGVLGLPDGETPYMVPMSFGYDGEDSLYFTYVAGSGSRKSTLTEQTSLAGFLVYSVETPYNWESVRLQGTLSVVPEAEWDGLSDVLASAWRPALLEKAVAGGAIVVYEFDIDEQTGIKHTGLPPAFEP